VIRTGSAKGGCKFAAVIGRRAANLKWRLGGDWQHAEYTLLMLWPFKNKFGLRTILIIVHVLKFPCHWKLYNYFLFYCHLGTKFKMFVSFVIYACYA